MPDYIDYSLELRESEETMAAVSFFPIKFEYPDQSVSSQSQNTIFLALILVFFLFQGESSNLFMQK